MISLRCDADEMSLGADDDDEEAFRRQCEMCKQWSPATRTQHTLISAKLGWRLLRHTLEDGSLRVEWRCPACYLKMRSARFGVDPKDE